MLDDERYRLDAVGFTPAEADAARPARRVDSGACRSGGASGLRASLNRLAWRRSKKRITTSSFPFMRGRRREVSEMSEFEVPQLIICSPFQQSDKPGISKKARRRRRQRPAASRFYILELDHPSFSSWRRTLVAACIAVSRVRNPRP